MARAKDRRLLEKDRWIKGIPLVLFLIFFALPVFAAPTVESGAEKSSVDSWLRTLRSYYIDEEIEVRFLNMHARGIKRAILWVCRKIYSEG